MNELKSSQQTEGIKCSKGNSVAANNKSCGCYERNIKTQRGSKKTKAIKN